MDDIPNIPTDDNNDFMYSSSDYQSELMSFLSESAEMRRTAKGAVKQTLYSAGGAFVGSMVLGPAGGLIGGIVGSVTGYMKSDDYDGVIVKLLDLETNQKTRLVKEVFGVMRNAGVTYETMGTAQEFGIALQNYVQQEHVRNGIWDACVSSLRT